ncbi:securin [Brienomyrus brachyistius]|uniref:securin n=1 Tax=Brienomyrus brachyistius TaxID=42636 RepID=UPI0020B351C0|nr:securin [Brienomyrus brachyistius]
MATIICVDKENGSVPAAAPSKLRDRLQSAPGCLPSSRSLKTPFSKKLQMAPPLQSGRKALGAVNKISSTLSASGQKSKHLAVQAQAEVKAKTQKSEVEYPEMEKFIPYNPLDFESFEVPEEIRLSHLCLAGLGSFPVPQDLPEDDLEIPDIHVEMSPLKSTSGGLSAELDSFLQSINELMVEMPPEMDC